MGTTDNGHYNNGNLNNGDSNNREFDNGISFDKGNRSGSHDKRNFNNGMILMTMTTPSTDIMISMQCLRRIGDRPRRVMSSMVESTVKQHSLFS